MDQIIKDYLRLEQIKKAFNISKELSIKKTCELLNISSSTFYMWKKKFKEQGEEGIKRSKPVARKHPRQSKPSVIKKVLELRKESQLGALRIKWYLERYHAILISESTVTRILKRNNVSKLNKKASRRTLHSKRYAKTVPGHHVQVDVKFLNFDTEKGIVRRFQYTAIDDATRIRALKIYKRHLQKNAIDFIDYVVEKFPFRINTIRTDRGHEFQAKFHWHVEDLGMKHQYIKARTPQLNGKVERSHLTDQREFYQLISYKDDVDLEAKLWHWENFYNFDRPHMAFHGKTPYEALKECMK
jgi:transposase InsO family protein